MVRPHQRSSPAERGLIREWKTRYCAKGRHDDAVACQIDIRVAKIPTDGMEAMAYANTEFPEAT